MSSKHFFILKPLSIVSREYRSRLLLLSLPLLLSACAVSPDPDQAGLLSSMQHLSKGTYEKRHQERRKVLELLTKQQNHYKKREASLNGRLRKQHQELSRIQQSLQETTKRQTLTKRQLQSLSKLYTSKKNERGKLHKETTALDKLINRERRNASLQHKKALQLQKKRDKLRKELMMQSSF